VAAWDRQPTEGPTAHAALRVYLELGADRSLEAVRRKIGNGSVRRIELWSAQHAWVERAAAYDVHMAGIAQEAAEAALREAARREAELWAQRRQEQREKEWAVAQRLLQKAEQMLTFPLQRVTTEDGRQVIEPARWSFSTVGTLVEAAAKVARLAAEMEQGRVILSVDELRAMDDEEFARTAAQFGVDLGGDAGPDPH
jgi:hypothetical protein